MSSLLIFKVDHLGKRSSRASLLPISASLQRPPFAPIMSDRLRSCLEGMKKKFWQEHRHLPQDDIKLRWTAYVTPYTNILLDTDVRTLPSGLTSSTPGQQIPCQSTTKSCAATRRRGSVCAHLHLASFLREGADASIGYRPSCRTWPTLSRCTFVGADV